MRADLNKQLCERERVGHRGRFKDVRRRNTFTRFGEEGENLPAREGMRLRYTVIGNTKEFNENLNPLRGQVRRAIGRRWDAFYSELCQHFDMRSRINQHILQHLKDYCEHDDIVVKHGTLYLRSRSGDSADVALRDSWVQYYVDPRDGIIKYNKYYLTVRQLERVRQKLRRQERAQVERWIDADQVLRQVEGIWFVYTMKDVPKGYTVIDKPASPALFKTRSGLRSWEQLDQYDRRRFGERRYFGRTVLDLFTGKPMRYDTSLPENQLKHQERRYHAGKRSACHKLLKQMGVV